METGKIVLGTLAGIAIGAVVGVLMAPDKGSETRKKLSQKGSELTGGLKDKYASLKDKYNTALDGATEKLESFTQKGEDLASNTKSASAPSIR
jgi:gas vesicle protein